MIFRVPGRFNSFVCKVIILNSQGTIAEALNSQICTRNRFWENNFDEIKKLLDYKKIRYEVQTQ